MNVYFEEIDVKDVIEMLDNCGVVEVDLEKVKFEEYGFRNRVWVLEEEKCKLYKDLVVMILKEIILRDKVREFEL